MINAKMKMDFYMLNIRAKIPLVKIIPLVNIFYILYNIMTTLKGLCTPVQVFVVLAVISTIFYLITMFTNVHISDPVDPGSYLYKNNAVQYGYMALVLKIIFYIMFGYLLQVLCKHRLDNVAWIILFLPYVLFAFIMVYVMSIGALATIRGR